MSNGQIPTVLIPCPQGCGRRETRIGRNQATLKFKYVPAGQGKITGITGLDDPPFSNKRFVDPDFLVDYAGTGSAPESWSYRPVSDPECKKLADEEPQLTNEPQ